METETLFCKLDDFCQAVFPICESHLLPKKVVTRRRKYRLGLSEIATIIVYCHCSGYRHFKDYYLKHVSKNYRS